MTNEIHLFSDNRVYVIFFYFFNKCYLFTHCDSDCIGIEGWEGGDRY